LAKRDERTKDESEDMIKRFSIKRMPPHCAKKEKIRPLRGSNPGGAIGENRESP
jgi:hypothetical protein